MTRECHYKESWFKTSLYWLCFYTQSVLIHSFINFGYLFLHCRGSCLSRDSCPCIQWILGVPRTCLGQDMPGILHPGNAQEASKSDDRTMPTGYFQYRIWQSNGPLLSTVVVLRDGPLILLWLERVTGKKSEGSLTSRLTLWNVIFSKHIRVMFRYLLICS